MHSFSKQVIKHKRILYDLFVTIENMIIGNSFITRRFKDGCSKYEIRSRSSQPTVLLIYEETISRKGIPRNNNFSMELKGEEHPHTEIVLPNEQTPGLHIKNMKFNYSNLGKADQYLDISVSKQDITDRRIIYDLFVTIEVVIIGASSVMRDVTDRVTMFKITSTRHQPTVIILYELPPETENSDSVLKLNHNSENIPYLTNTHSTESHFARKNVTTLGAVTEQEEPEKRQHTGQEIYTYGNKYFPDLSKKMTAKQMHTIEKPYKCLFCEKTFAQYSSKKSHERQHTGEKPYKCQFCEKKFAHSSSKKSHERLHTGEKPYKCQFCGKTFADSSSKRYHERLHTGETPYQCGYCERKFAQPSHKMQHERQHTGEKPYKCQLCGKTFADSSSKRYHERQHTGEKPHQCGYCERKFAQSSHKIRHERQHTGEKPHQCGYCERKFAQSSHKIRHERQHTGEEPYECLFCDKTYARLSDKKMHERCHARVKPYQREYGKTFTH